MHTILNIFIYFSEYDSRFFLYMLISTKKKKNIKLNFQNNWLNITNLASELCKIEKDKIIRTIENIFLN